MTETPRSPWPREVQLAALDAALDGDLDAARTHVAGLAEADRSALADAARALLDTTQSLTDSPDGGPVEWVPAFPSLGRFGTPDTEEKVRAMVDAWNAKVADGRESIPAAVYRRSGGGDWEPAE